MMPTWYDIRGFFILKLAYRDSLKKQIKFFAENLKGIHLEVAVGSGTLLKMCLESEHLADEKDLDVDAFDLSADMVESAHKKLLGHQDVFVTGGSVYQINTMDNYYDSINCANAIHCFGNSNWAFEEMYRVLKLQGRLRLNVLLEPPQTDRLAQRINQYGMRKGILNKPFKYSEMVHSLRMMPWQKCTWEQYGNSLYVECVK